MRVYIVDHEPIVRAGLRFALSCDPDLLIVGEAVSAREAFRDLEAARPDVVILDVVLPGMDGISATREVKRRVPRASVVVFTVHERPRDLLDVLAAGATAYVMKTEPLESLRLALRAAASGTRYVSPALAPVLARGVSEGQVDVLDGLSVREREIFQVIAAGRSIEETANEFCISRKTVETHVYRVYRKLGCHNVSDLVRFAAQHGLLRTTPSRARRWRTALDHPVLQVDRGSGSPERVAKVAPPENQAPPHSGMWNGGHT